MKHRYHLICLAGAGIAVALLLFGSGSNLPLVGIGAVLLICPIVMGAMMWLMMRQTPQQMPQQTTNREQLRDPDDVNAGGL